MLGVDRNTHVDRVRQQDATTLPASGEQGMLAQGASDHLGDDVSKRGDAGFVRRELEFVAQGNEFGGIAPTGERNRRGFFPAGHHSFSNRATLGGDGHFQLGRRRGLGGNIGRGSIDRQHVTFANAATLPGGS